LVDLGSTIRSFSPTFFVVVFRVVVVVIVVVLVIVVIVVVIDGYRVLSVVPGGLLVLHG
jgi:hypothetical protein